MVAQRSAEIAAHRLAGPVSELGGEAAVETHLGAQRAFLRAGQPAFQRHPVDGVAGHHPAQKEDEHHDAGCLQHHAREAGREGKETCGHGATSTTARFTRRRGSRWVRRASPTSSRLTVSAISAITGARMACGAISR